jgi:hypothetical protein
MMTRAPYFLFRVLFLSPAPNTNLCDFPMRSIILIPVVFAVIGCSKPKPTITPEQSPRSQRLPSATEVFNLRTKCQEIVNKDVQDSLIGVAGSALSVDVKSHYNPVTNHCYAEVTVMKNFFYEPSKVANDYRTTTLYDAQTVDLLLGAKQENDKQSGNDFTDETKVPLSTYDAVLNKIHLLMTQE